MTSMAFVFLVGVSVLLVCRPIFAELKCEEDVHTNCPGGSLYFSNSEHGFFSDKFLTEHCRVILEDIDCKTNYFHGCDHENHNLFLLLTRGIKELFSELCNETSALREGYRQHISCFQNSAQNFRSCAFSSQQSAQNFQNDLIENNEAHFDDEQLKIKGMCILHSEFRKCSFNAVKTSCGDDAATYLQTLISMAIQDLVNEVC